MSNIPRLLTAVLYSILLLGAAAAAAIAATFAIAVLYLVLSRAFTQISELLAGSGGAL